MDKLSGMITSEYHYLSKEYSDICYKILKEPIRFHRKQWELVYVIRMLELKNLVNNNSTGISFGSGVGCEIKALANKGCKIIVTDLNEGEAKNLGWVDTNQHTKNLEAFKDNRFDNYDYINNLTIDNNVDMNNIPKKYLEGQFDFAISVCALEHLGSLQKGLDFIINSIKCVKIGGIVVHTTEFNLNSLYNDYDGKTIEHRLTSVYRAQDLKKLREEVEKMGNKMYCMDYTYVDGLYDKYIDLPPYPGNDNNKHLRAELSDGLIKIPATCVGIVIERLI
jgi:hypothetical protein